MFCDPAILLTDASIGPPKHIFKNVNRIIICKSPKPDTSECTSKVEYKLQNNHTIYNTAMRMSKPHVYTKVWVNSTDKK